jgi:hypothetical protein
LFNNSILYNGKAIGTWRRDIHGSKVSVEVKLLDEPKPSVNEALTVEVERYAAFSGLTAEYHLL